MTALLIITSIFTGIAGLITAYKVGQRSSFPKDMRDENTKLKADLKRESSNGVDLSNRLHLRAREVALLKTQRDNYAEIAKTHDVVFPKFNRTSTKMEKVWDKRLYRGHPDDNLTALSDDLQPFQGREVHLSIEFQGRGGWRGIIKKTWTKTEQVYSHAYARYRDEKVPSQNMGPITFQGPPDRILEEVRTFLLDDDTGLVRWQTAKRNVLDSELIQDGGSQRKAWRDPDSPLRFLVTAEVSEPIEMPVMPEIQYVEVLKIQTEIEQVIIEKPIVLSIPEGEEANLCGHTKAEIVNLIDAVLEVRGDSEDTLAAEIQALPDLSKETVEISEAQVEENA